MRGTTVIELKDCLAKMNNKGENRSVLERKVDECDAARLLDLRMGKEQLVVNGGN